MADITRRTAKILLDQMLKQYRDAMKACIDDKDVIPAEALQIVNDYENNQIGELIDKILNTKDFFSNYDAESYFNFFDNMRALIKGFDLKLPRDVELVDSITDKESIVLISKNEKKTLKPKERIKLQLLKGEEKSELPTRWYNVEWSVENITGEKISKYFILDALENKSVLFDQTNRSFTFKEAGNYRITAYVYEQDIWGRKELADVLTYEQEVVGDDNNLSTYESAWIFVTDKNNKVIKIINNDGNSIIFVNPKGEVTKKSPFEKGSYTEFFGDNLGITKESANELLKKARYSWDGEKMQGGYKAFDLNGNEVDSLIVEKKNKPIKSQKIKPKKEIYLKQRPLEEKYGYPYTAPSFGSLCLATSIINLYILDDGLSIENVEKFMDDAKGKFIEPNGNVISFENMSRKLSELNSDEKYFDYVYYNPETKTYSATKKAMTKEDFIKSDYDYGIGAYIHLDEDPDSPKFKLEIKHYELVKRVPFMEYNPGISAYQLYEIYPVSKYKR